MSDKNRIFETQLNTNSALVATGVKIDKGDLVGLNVDGYARPFEGTDVVMGFATESADNTNGENGDISVELRGRGKVCLDVANVSQSHLGSSVYATGPDAFDLTSSTKHIGKIIRIDKSGSAIVSFDFMYALELALAVTPDTDTTPADEEVE